MRILIILTIILFLVACAPKPQSDVTIVTEEEIQERQEQAKKTAFRFPEGSIVRTENDVSVSIDGYEVDDKENWGKVTIKTTVLNRGEDTISPYMTVRVYNVNEHDTGKIYDDQAIYFSELKQGQYQKKETKAISYQGNGTKIIELTVFDGRTDKIYKVKVQTQFL